MKNPKHKFIQRLKSFLLGRKNKTSTISLHLLAAGISLSYEVLEPRIALSAQGLVDVGTQPEGALSGKIVYTHAGHGFTANNTGSGAWGFQRPLLLNMIEDTGNQDQMTYFADYLFRAGATVVPLRPVGHQPNEIILDNDDVEVTFTGAWSDSGASIYFGDVGDVPYRFASTSATETATAEYRPNVTEAGFYPVYAWTRYGSDRASDQLYRINHSGGSTEVTVNHRRVGNGLVYLGTYHFETGTEGSVEISNRSSELGRVVIADMIRFGNGVGDIDRGGGISGKDREDEAGLYWVQWHVDRSQGIPDSEYRVSTSDSSATVSLAPRYAEYMNRSTDGSLSDRVFVSYHSNAATTLARGVLALYNGNNNPSSATPNQFLLANTLGREVNDDLVDQNGQFEHDWFDRGTVVTLDRSDIEFGEISNLRINNEFDATILETGFHDNTEDAQLLRDPKVRDALARATYQGVVKYFNSVDSGATPTTMLPGKPTDVYTDSAGDGTVSILWTPPTVNTYNGDAPTGYRIYGSTNGYGFDGGTFVAGGGTTSFTFNNLDSNEGTYYFKVVAVNAGGESPASEVMAVTPNLGAKDILIVNGFDRHDRFLNPTQPGGSGGTGLNERVRPRQNNSFDYTVQVASAIEANSPKLVVDSASNEAVIAGDVDLDDYEAVIWISGEESSVDDTFDTTEQTLVTNYLSDGGKLFVSGAEIGWDLDHLDYGRAFYNDQLKAVYVSDDANTYNVQGAAGSIFAGLSFSFDEGSIFYDAQFPDQINPLGGATSALTYVGGSGGNAAVVFDGGATQVVNFGFPFETITTASDRNAVMDRVLDFFGIEEPAADFNSDTRVNGADALAFYRGFGTVSGATLADGDADGNQAVDALDFIVFQSQFGQTPSLTVALAKEADEGNTFPEIDAMPSAVSLGTDAINLGALVSSLREGFQKSLAPSISGVIQENSVFPERGSEETQLSLIANRPIDQDIVSIERVKLERKTCAVSQEEIVDRVLVDLLQGDGDIGE